MTILHVVGARPNFMKLAPVHRACARLGMRQLVVHTGQHYGERMSDAFFRDLELPPADLNLEVGSGTHVGQIATVMLRIEPVLREHAPGIVLVYGDVNSTLATALVCAKLELPVAHVEAGLRSFDRGMPEELNRVLTDQMSELLFIPSSEAADHLAREGVAPGRVHFVGNVMADTLLRSLDRAKAAAAAAGAGEYGLLTLHRPSNVDEPATLRGFLDLAVRIAQRMPLVFPVHPRTRQRLDAGWLAALPAALRLTEPMGYLDFLALQAGARFVITDSGGVQEETTLLGVPCLTARENTERPVTVTLGTNTVVGTDPARILAAVDAILAGGGKTGSIPPLWDGRSGERIAAVLQAWGAS